MADFGDQLQPAHIVYPNPGGTGFFELRPYQEESVLGIFEKFSVCNSTLVVMATGLGKTVILSEVTLRWPDDVGRIMVLAHREELIDQAADKIELHIGERPGIEMGQRKELESGHSIFDRSKVLVASVQTMQRDSRLRKFNPSDFGLIIVDEGHHAVSDGYRKVVQYFTGGNPQTKVLYVTATPNRHDKIGLHNVCESVAYKMDIRQGIDEGYLCDIEQRYVMVDGLDFSGCRKVAGDLNSKDLANAMMGGTSDGFVGELTDEQRDTIELQEKMLHAVVTPTIQEAAGRPTLVFAVNVEHAVRMTEIFNRHPGVTARCVHSGNESYRGTEKDERKELIRQYQSGQVQVLVNVGCLTEGFDAPATAVVAVARPTSSESLYVQMIGRGTRPKRPPKEQTAAERKEAIANSDKPKLLVLDFVGNSGRHKLMSVVDVLAGDDAEPYIERAKEIAMESEEPTDMRKAIQQAKDEEAERKRQEQLAAERERQRKEEARRAKIRAQAEYRTRTVDGFALDSVAQREAPVFRGGSSDSQIAYLVRLGVKEETAMRYSKAQAGAVINNLKSRKGGDFICTFGKQAGNAIKDIPSGFIDFIINKTSDFPGRQEFIENVRVMRGESVGVV